MFVGAMASLQIPAGFCRNGSAPPLVLALGTALAGLGYCLAGLSAGFVMLLCALLIGGVGASTQHPIASALVARAFAGPRSLKALGTYNFCRRSRQDDDSGGAVADAARDAVAAGTGRSWQSRSRDGRRHFFVHAALSSRRRRRKPEPTPVHDRLPPAVARLRPVACNRHSRQRDAHGILLFVPFVLKAKGASLQTVGLAMTLIFAGGAAGKLACTFLGARIGAIATVWVTESATALGILACCRCRCSPRCRYCP